MVQETTKIAILGGGEEELNVLSEFHRTPGIEIIGVYDRDPRAVALDIAEIIGVPAFSDGRYLAAFVAADYVIVTSKRNLYTEEITALRREKQRILNPAEAVSCFTGKEGQERGRIEDRPWPDHLEEALNYLYKITDRHRLLKWLLEISVRAVGATSGSIMLHAEQTDELFIGYATGLSSEVVKRTRQKIGEGIAGEVALTGESKLITERVAQPLYEESRDRGRIFSAISVPLRFEDRLLGVINVSTDVGEKRLGHEEVGTIELLAEKIAPILDQHLRIDTDEIREIEFQIRRDLESLHQKEIGFHDKFTLLCSMLSEKLGADTVSIYTATDAGDWLILGGSDQQITAGGNGTRIHCIKGSLARAYLENEDVLMTQAKQDDDLKLRIEANAITSVYVPLRHKYPLGVLMLEFSDLDKLETFFRLKDSIRFQVGYFTQSLLKEERQQRMVRNLEELSAITPEIMNTRSIEEKVAMLPALLAHLVGAERGSMHFESGAFSGVRYHGFETDTREALIAHDEEIFSHVQRSGQPSCMSYLDLDVEMLSSGIFHQSIIAFPLLESRGMKAAFIGYGKHPTSPLDSSVFGKHELDLLAKAGEILSSLLAGESRVQGSAPEPLDFDGLLRMNQKLLLDKIREEIERAQRYQHGFVFTLFQVAGLKDMMRSDQGAALKLINDLSRGIRKQVRKTDFFSWIETDLFAVLSLESYQRMTFLEDRINGFVTKLLEECKLFDPERFHPSSSYTLFPGTADNPTGIIGEVKRKLSGAA